MVFVLKGPNTIDFLNFVENEKTCCARVHHNLVLPVLGRRLVDIITEKLLSLKEAENKLLNDRPQLQLAANWSLNIGPRLMFVTD